LNVHYFVAFLRSQKEVQVRQQTIFKKKDGCQIASTKLVASPWAGLTKQIYKQLHVSS